MPASERAIVFVSREMRASDREWTSRRTDSFRFKLSLLPLPRSIQALPSLFPTSNALLLASDLLVKSFEVCVTSRDEG